MKSLLKKISPLLLLLVCPAWGQIAPDSIQAQGLVHLPRSTVMNFARRLTVAEELNLATKMLEEVRIQNATDTTEIGNVLAVLRDVNRYQFRADSIQRQEQEQRQITDSIQRLQQQETLKQQKIADTSSGGGLWLLMLVLACGAAGAYWYFFVFTKKSGSAPVHSAADASSPNDNAPAP